MAEIQSLGIGSGVLNADLVDQLIGVEREAADFRLDQKEAVVEAQISALGDLGSLVTELESAARSVSGVSSLNAKLASSTNESAISATSSSIASTGSWLIDVNQLAQYQSIASSSFTSADSALGTGTLRFDFGEVSHVADTSFDFAADTSQSAYEITIDASNNSLQGVADTINQADIGVNAAVIDTGDGVRLVLAGDDTGANQGFTLTVDSADAQLSSLAYNETAFSGGLDTEQLQAATNALLSINGLDVSRDNNLVIDVINGVTLNLKETTAQAVNVAVEPDLDTVATRIDNFVAAYNNLRLGINEATDYNTDTNQGSVFTGDSTIRLLADRLRGLLNQSISLISNGSFSSLSEIGITIADWQTGELTFNRSALETMMSLYPDDIDAIFGSDGRTSTDDIEFLSATSSVVPGSYQVVVTQAAQAATWQGRETGASSFTIDDTSDNFSVTVNGTASGNLSLIQGVYTGDELAAEMANRINSATTISDAGYSVSVSFDSTAQSFSIATGTKGSDASVAVTSADAGLISTAGFMPQNIGGFVTDSVSALAVADTLAAPLVIDDTNDQMSISVEDTAIDLTLAQGTYTTLADVTAAVQTALSANTDVVALGVSADVSSFASTTASSLQVDLTKNGDAIAWQLTSLEGDLGDLLGLTGGGYNGTPSESLAVTAELAVGVSGTLDFVLDIGATQSAALSVAIASSAGDSADDIASAIQAAINADAALSADNSAAAATASLNITTSLIDFSANPQGFTLNYGGTDYDILINSNAVADTADNATDNIAEIQAAIDGAVGAGALTVVASGSSFSIETVASGSSAEFSIVADGTSATTASGVAVVPASVDYSGTNADSITFNYAGENFTVALGIAATDYVSGGALAASPYTSSAEVQAYVQQQLDYALEQAGLRAGDIVVNNSSDQLSFETVSVRGVSNSFSHGSTAELEVVSLTDANNILPAAAVYSDTGTADALAGFGLAVGSYKGLDGANVQVAFEGDEEGGRFVVQSDRYEAFSLSSLSAFATSELGFTDGSQQTKSFAGTDVMGTIGGEVATGDGSVLEGAGDLTTGLRVDATASTAGVAGRVTWITGIAKQITSFLDNFTAPGNALSIKTTRLDEKLAEIGEDRQRLDTRMESRRALLVRQFTYADSLVANLNTTGDFLRSQLDILTSLVAKRDAK